MQTQKLVTEPNKFDNYTLNALENRILFEISSETRKIDGEFHWINLEYASRFLHRFFVFEHKNNVRVPKKNIHTEVFQIRKSSLQPELIETLEKLEFKEVNTMMISVVRRLLQSVDKYYYHTSGIHGKIDWRFVDFICLI